MQFRVALVALGFVGFAVFVGCGEEEKFNKPVPVQPEDPAPLVTDSCTDGVKNQDESDADCGGAICSARCAEGQMCSVDSDCTGHMCDNGHCLTIPPSPGVSRRLTVRRIVHALSALIIRRCQAMVLDQGIPFSPRSQSRRRRFARPRCSGKSWKKCCISPVEFGIFLPRLMNGTMVMLSWSILTIGLSSARWPHRRTTGKLRRHASG